MRKMLSIAVAACVAAGVLAACGQNAQQPAPDTAAQQAPAAAPLPSDPNDKTAWKQYLVGVVNANMQIVKGNHPYMYFVPGGDDDASKTDRANQLDNVKTVVSRGVLPNNTMAFGGPNSTLTAQLIVDAFKDAQAGSFKDVVVIFVGAPAGGDTV
ncbi:MAG TPA: hypothetical protein VGC30_02355, partial [Dokdonella sp.]